MRILNVGCGSETYGTDFIDMYPSRKEVKKCDVNNEPFPFKDNAFDEVYSRSLFEHLKNPNLVLKEMVRVCKKGGKVLIITDNASYWVWALAKRVHTEGYEDEKYPEDRHYSLFTDSHLKNQFKAAGLKLDSIRYIPDPNPPRNRLLRFGRDTISHILRRTPLWRMGYSRIEISGSKT